MTPEIAYIFEGMYVGLRHRLSSLNSPSSVVLSCGCLIGLFSCGYGTLLYQRAQANPYPYPFPPLPTVFNQELVKRVGLTPESHWKGCVATLTGKPNAGTSWLEQSTWDFVGWGHAGSEYRGVCLWWLNIPTLFVYNPNMSVDYYYLVTRLLASKDDSQVKEVTVLTRPNFPLLRLLGARILISDQPLSPNPQIQAITNPPPPENIYAYELENSNLSGFSPVNTIRCRTVQETLEKITASDFDPANETVIFEDISTPLTKADHSEFIWAKNKVRIIATAPGMCLLVLPLQYSHCLRLNCKDSNRAPARLVRVDLALTGILFSQSLDAVVSCDYGPFSNVFAKFKDYLDLKRLNLK